MPSVTTYCVVVGNAPLIIGSPEAANDSVLKTSVGVDMMWEIVELGISDRSCGNVVSDGR